VTGLGDGDRGRDGFEVPHLADQEHVRRLAEGRPQRVGKGGDIGTDLALLDNTSLVPVHILDRILDRDHVAGTGRHDVIHHRGQRGGLAGSGRTRHQDQALAETRQPANHGGHAELVKVRDLIRNQAQGQADRASLLEGVDSKSRVAFPVEGEIEVAPRLETGPALRREHLLRHPFDLVGAERVRADRHEGAVLAHGRRGACREDQVGRALLEQDLEVGVDDQGMGVRGLAWGCG